MGNFVVLSEGEALLVKTASRLSLRDVLNATVFFEQIAAASNRPGNCIHRMLSVREHYHRGKSVCCVFKHLEICWQL